MDISPTIVPNSAQINADDLTTAPRTVTVTKVEAGTAEQPVFIHVDGFPDKTYRPGKSMRRVLVIAWGKEASDYVGRSMTLYNDPTIRFGRDVTGGIRISHLSHIEKELTIPLTVTRGKREPFIVKPLTTPKPADHEAALKNATTLPELQTAWQSIITAGVAGNRQLVALKDLRKVELTVKGEAS